MCLALANWPFAKAAILSQGAFDYLTYVFLIWSLIVSCVHVLGVQRQPLPDFRSQIAAQCCKVRSRRTIVVDEARASHQARLCARLSPSGMIRHTVVPILVKLLCFPSPQHHSQVLIQCPIRRRLEPAYASIDQHQLHNHRFETLQLAERIEEGGFQQKVAGDVKLDLDDAVCARNDCAAGKAED